jgi:hypothetical protein
MVVGEGKKGQQKKGLQLAEDIKQCEQRRVKSALTRRRRPRRRGKDDCIKYVGASKQKQIGEGAGATGIEPETAIQRECSVTRRPHKPPLRVF